jgi:HAD superfamily hydrolase (TIGR01549 family)
MIKFFYSDICDVLLTASFNGMTYDRLSIKSSHQLLKEILEKNIRVGLFTNMSDKTIAETIKDGTAPDLDYSVKISASELNLLKADPKMLQICTEKAGVKPEEIFFIDDKVYNVEAAKEFGWQGLTFETNNPDKSIKEIKKQLQF